MLKYCSYLALLSVRTGRDFQNIFFYVKIINISSLFLQPSFSIHHPLLGRTGNRCSFDDLVKSLWPVKAWKIARSVILDSPYMSTSYFRHSASMKIHPIIPHAILLPSPNSIKTSKTRSERNNCES